MAVGVIMRGLSSTSAVDIPNVSVSRAGVETSLLHRSGSIDGCDKPRNRLDHLEEKGMKTSIMSCGMGVWGALMSMDNGRSPDLDSQALIKGIWLNDIRPAESPRQMEFHSLGMDNAISLQQLQICTSSSGAFRTFILTNSSAGRHSTKISAQISGGVRLLGDISAL
jgi:hypothetical protein